MKLDLLDYAGLCISVFFCVSYFIPVTIDYGKKVVEERLLGILIFHNVFVFSTIILILLWVFFGRKYLRIKI